MTEKSNQQEPQESYANLMGFAVRKTKLEAGVIRDRGYGGILTIISAPQDTSEQNHLINIIRDHLSIEQTDVEHIDIGNIMNALELGIQRYNLGISDATSEKQSLPENVFQYVYRNFGKNKQGWRLGREAILDSMKELLEKAPYDLEGTLFGDFLRTLELDPEKDRKASRLIVLHYPSLDETHSIRKLSDVDAAYADSNRAERINKIISIYSIINQVYPGKFQTDNPQGNTVVNIIDNSHRYFAARNSRWANACESMRDCIETPTAHEEDSQILERG